MAPILGKPVSRRSLLRTAGAITGAVGTLALLQDGAIVPQRLALADPATPFPDVQFDLGPFMPPAVTYDGIPVGMPPVHTVFLTATLSRTPSRADQSRMESALRTIESNYPYAPGGVFTHVSYSDNYFARLPGSLVDANMPRTLSGNQPVLKRAVASPTDVAPGAHVLELRRPEFNVPLRLENNDVLFTVSGDDSSYVADVVNWLSGSNKLVGRSIASPRFDAGMRITSSRAMFVQIGLPRYVAANAGFKYQSFVNSDSSMWMGFLDQQVDASAPAQNVTFVGGGGIHLSNAKAGAYFDNGSVQHLSHNLMDLEQFYLNGNNADEPDADHREPFDERVQYMFHSPPVVEQNPNDPFFNGGGPTNLDMRGAVLPNQFHGADYAERSAQQFQRIGHLSSLQRSGRTADGRPIHQRIDGPGFDAMDTTTGRNTPKLQFSGFFPSADFFATMRSNQSAVDLLEKYDLEEEDHGLERFITSTRRQNFLIPPRRHRAFPLVEFL
ncbi:hypothetical protein [Kutzneria sp. NPDC051319]|uniref:DUF7405 family protein n=1 Tax=Kutzneria sp. NPDC051319 TaxID=3155047 RepID=UPI00344376BE